MANCLKCKHCLLCRDLDPTDMNTEYFALLCTASKAKGVLCKEISYIMPLGYDSLFANYPLAEDPWITVLSRFEDLESKSSTPDWCPYKGPEMGEHKIVEDTAESLTISLRK